MAGRPRSSQCLRDRGQDLLLGHPLEHSASPGGWNRSPEVRPVAPTAEGFLSNEAGPQIRGAGEVLGFPGRHCARFGALAHPAASAGLSFLLCHLPQQPCSVSSTTPTALPATSGSEPGPQGPAASHRLSLRFPGFWLRSQLPGPVSRFSPSRPKPCPQVTMKSLAIRSGQHATDRREGPAT